MAESAAKMAARRGRRVQCKEARRVRAVRKEEA